MLFEAALIRGIINRNQISGSAPDRVVPGAAVVVRTVLGRAIVAREPTGIGRPVSGR